MYTLIRGTSKFRIELEKRTSNYLVTCLTSGRELYFQGMDDIVEIELMAELGDRALNPYLEEYFSCLAG